MLHDAGWDWSGATTGHRHNILWAHTTLTSLAKSTVLPVAQLGTIFEKSLARVGILQLAGVQIILPVAPSTVMTSGDVSHILDLANPFSKYEIEIEIDGGDGGSFSDLVSEIVADRLISDALDYGLGAVQTNIDKTNKVLIQEPSPMTRVGWLGEGESKLRVIVAAPEFSIEICCHIISSLTRILYLAGVRSSVMISIATSQK